MDIEYILGYLAAKAIGIVQKAGQSLADRATEYVEKQVLALVESHPKTAPALREAAEHPQDPDYLDSLRLELRKAVKSSAEFLARAQELVEADPRANEVVATQSAVADRGAKVVQVAGNHNQTSIS